ncbi:hypothetical protein PCC7424_1217 [Gloeothece citriformis PCC 7424]|uniref:Uncharacterized protein n=1 Tax=Gloeothece citriformis (strain PCC 7424) TaxID=65393 RepID=B7K797_GLOC7|nr:hypothetical protein [Gloeothece citriformis]ACK69665.1 hypothetical protein PCC7424_1217 [Gloeothece citriformis PCC 7424]
MEFNTKPNQLEQFYCNELIKAGVDPNKATQAAKTMTEKELLLIGEIWEQWGNVLAKSQQSVLAS